MKTYIALSVLGFIICTAFNKPTKLITDYRDAHAGTYFCKSKVVIANLTHGGSTVINDTISVKVTKDALDSILQITTGCSVSKFKLKNNILYAYPEGGHRGGGFTGADSIFVSMTQGHAGTVFYAGKKR